MTARALVGLAIVIILGVGIAFRWSRHHAVQTVALPTPCDEMRDAGTNPKLSLRDACRSFAEETVANRKNNTNAGAESATLQAADDYRALFKADLAVNDRSLAAADYATAKKLYAIANISLDRRISDPAAVGLRDLEDAYNNSHLALGS